MTHQINIIYPFVFFMSINAEISALDFKSLKNKKVAIVHDFTWQNRGGEKVVEVLLEMFPKADFFMMFGDTSVYPQELIKDRKITYSFLNKFPFIKKYYRYTYFLWPTAVETFNLNEYDIVISSSASVSKGVITPASTKHICYVHSPMRYAWDQMWEYFSPQNFNWIKRMIIPLMITFIRVWDYTSTSRIDYLITNSEFIAGRCKKYYRRSPDQVIYPPVYTDDFYISDKTEDYLLSVAPYEQNKGGINLIEYAKKSGCNVKIIGDGSMRKKLQKLAKGYDNIQFLGRVPDKEKYELFAHAKALVHCGVEDFGIQFIEALASGIPILAYGKGGAKEIVSNEKIGYTYENNDYASFQSALDKINKVYSANGFDKKNLQQRARNFSKQNFISRIYRAIKESLNNASNPSNNRK